MFARAVVVIVDGMALGEHSLMQDARNNNTFGILSVKHYVPTMLHAAQAGANIITGSAESGMIGKLSAARF